MKLAVMGGKRQRVGEEAHRAIREKAVKHFLPGGAVEALAERLLDVVGIVSSEQWARSERR
jgi:hypothetical protein